MTIDDPVLIQVYATVLTGVLIFMTVQRLFESESKRLSHEKKDAEEDEEKYKNELGVVENHLQRNKDPDIIKMLEDQRKEWKSIIDLTETRIKNIITRIRLNDLRYKKKNIEHRSIKETERFLNVVMVALMGLSIIVVLVGYEKIISVIFFSIGIILLIVRVCFHGEEVG
jgi:predicted RNase H-like nuclease (RuvC/YqgF family)